GAHVGGNGGGCGGGRLGDGVHGEEAQQGRDERGPMEGHVFFSLISPAAAAYRTPGMEGRRVRPVSPARAPCADCRGDGRARALPLRSTRQSARRRGERENGAAAP